MRIPDHIGVIPDGNRRWAENHGLSKEKGYSSGLAPGLQLYKLCKETGVKELTFYGFTMDNTKRPTIQTQAFRQACVDAVEMLAKEDASLLVAGNTETPMFPEKLIKYTGKRRVFGQGGIKINFLVNYGWKWDLSNLSQNERIKNNKIISQLNTNDISRIDLIIRWGGRRRLSGFLPAQSIYADIYIIDELWPDFKPEHFYRALEWYDKQDVTYGG